MKDVPILAQAIYGLIFGQYHVYELVWRLALLDHIHDDHGTNIDLQPYM